jgi:replicative DNA helicase
MTEFEPILLKKLLYSGEYFGKVIPIIKKEHFSDIGGQELFKLAKDYHNEYRDIPTLTELVAKVKDVQNAEIRAEIISTLRTVRDTEEVQNNEFMLNETVRWVKDAMYLSALQIGSEGLMNKDDDLKMKAQLIMDERSKVSIDSDLGLDFDDIETMIAYYSERNVGILTAHEQLNKRLGPGFLPATLSVILAASGIGKSLLMTDLISGMIKNNKNILLVSLEMADKEIMKRVHANAMDLPINSLLDLNKTQEELAKLERPLIDKEQVLAAYNKMKSEDNCGKLFIKDYASGAFSPLMLERLVESYKIEKEVEFDIVFVDYLGIMKSDLLTPNAGLYSYVKSIAEETRASAKKLDIPIVSASQLNRDATNNIDGADNSNVSDSMGTVMTADFMMFLLQNEEMKEKKEIICKITKNRFGGITDTWLMNVDYNHMRFSDALTQNVDMSDMQVTDSLGLGNNPIDEDFGVDLAKKQEDMEEYANLEVKNIIKEDMTNVIANDNKSDPFIDNIDDLYAELGIS